VGGAGLDTLNGGVCNYITTSDSDSYTLSLHDALPILFSGLGPETMDGGTGIDLINHTAFNGNYVFNMTTGLTNFVGESYINFEKITRAHVCATVTYSACMKIINGETGDDILNGGAGND